MLSFGVALWFREGCGIECFSMHQVFTLIIMALVVGALGFRHRRSIRQSCSQYASLFYNDIYEVPLPAGHRFPMEKYRKVRTTLQSEFIAGVSFIESPLATVDELATTHCRNYIQRFLTGEGMTAAEVRAVGFPWSVPGTKRALSSVGGTVAAMRAVLNGESRASGHIAGGTHHAFFDYGEGFCVFSDIAVAANLALVEYSARVRKIVIIDLDVHQGNGNAKLFEKQPAVFTFSMHCAANLFSKKEVSDVDVEIEAGTGDAEYLKILNGWLPFLFDVVKPDLVFFQAGVDPFAGDRLGRLALTRDGLRERNSLVYEYVKSRNVPLVVTMGGGYPKSEHPAEWLEVIECHSDCYRQMIKVFA